MQEILKGRKCLLSINIAKVGAVQNAVKIDTHIISPSGVVSCVANGYDELKKVVALIISGEQLNELGAYSIDLRLVFADSVIVVPTFAFAEVVEGEVSCYGVSDVYVSIEGGEVVPGTSTPTINVVGREEFDTLSGKVADLEKEKVDTTTFEESLQDLDQAYGEILEQLLQDIDKKDDKSDLAGKQDIITITQKDNGNIVLLGKEFMPATPSGDPMHYAYETAGAVWNNGWTLNGVSLSTAEIADYYNRKGIPLGAYTYASNGTIKTYFPLPNCASGSNVAYCWQNNYELEILPKFVNGYNYLSSATFNRTFQGCKKLRSIGFIIFSPTSFTNAFEGCSALQSLNIQNLGVNISFADSPLLSKESLLYMINRCAKNKTFTITLHPDVYFEATGGEWEEAVMSAINDCGSDITLAEPTNA